MASKYILGVKDGAIVRVEITKPQAPRNQLVAWLTRTTEAARRAGFRRYAFRFGKEWQVLNIVARDPIRSFPNEDAAAMWLLYNG